MIHPSYSELIEAINTNNEDDDQSMVLNSRYSLVLATSKRARQLIAGSKPLVEKAAGKKPLSIAIDELYKGKVKILPGKKEDAELSLEEDLTPEDSAGETEGAESAAAAEKQTETAAEAEEGISGGDSAVQEEPAAETEADPED